jgi:hypothetical protein
MVTLRAMTDGMPHPKAQRQVIHYDLGPSFSSSEWWDESYINGSRLGIVFRPTDPEDNRFSVVVWDWTTGKMVLVCEFRQMRRSGGSASLTFSSSASKMSVARQFNS